MLKLKTFEKMVLTILTVGVLVLGIYPKPIITTLRRTIRHSHVNFSKIKISRLENRVRLSNAW